ncbi:MAG: hypothetical protein R3B48_07940 [Kofleriaceae bacterium]
MSASSTSRTVNLHVSASLCAEPGDQRPAVVAYAFSASGHLLGRAELDDKGAATLALKLGDAATAVRVLLGPQAGDAPRLDELLRRGAVERELRALPERDQLKLELPLGPDLWRPWLRRCLVKGRLLKRDPGASGAPDLPVYGATVEIYEVDPLHIVLPRLPPPWLARLRDLIAGPIVPPFPLPDPGPELRVELAPELELKVRASIAAAPELAPLRLAAEVASDRALVQALLDHAVIVRPWLCLLFPRLVTMQRIGTAFTDEQGRFQTYIWHSIFSLDQPDLYFRATQTPHGSAPITIYAPTPIACHTWWNYVCGTEVTLITTHPQAVPTTPRPDVDATGTWVLFTAIGNTSLARIHGGGAAGTTTSNLGLTDSGAPWGGVLRPRLDFDSDLRDVLGVKYYQLSWRRGTSGAFTPLDAPVSRHYAVYDGTDLILKEYPLGPNPLTVAGEALQLFELPPTVPPEGHWSVANAVLDTQNGAFASALHAPGVEYLPSGAVKAGTTDESGIYQLKLELFNAAGQRVHLVDPARPASPITYFVPTSTTLTGTIHTVAAASVAQPGGGSLVVGDALVLSLHLDNNRTWAGLGAPSTPSGTADPCCGVVHYGPGASATLPYEARHLHGFARHSLQVVRSATQILPTLTGGTGVFSLTRSVADLMSLALPAACAGNPPCTTAAFAEHLHVAATATDGWSEQRAYDSAATRAFALSP